MSANPDIEREAGTLMSELGIIAATGIASIDKLIATLCDETDAQLPSTARGNLLEMSFHRCNEGGTRLDAA